jgi:hypothetical protein
MQPRPRSHLVFAALSTILKPRKARAKQSPVLDALDDGTLLQHLGLDEAECEHSYSELLLGFWMEAKLLDASHV